MRQAYDAPPPSEQRLALGEKLEGDWWAQFHSAALDQLMRLALAGNQDIAAAKSRVAQAQEEVNAAHGALLPQVSLGATAGRQKYGAALFGPLDITIPPFTYYTVGPTVSAPLDRLAARGVHSSSRPRTPNTRGTSWMPPICR